jgi:protein-tyrosine sulfotransferase
MTTKICQTLLLIALLANFNSAHALFRPTPTCNKLVDRYEIEHGKHVTPKNISDAFIFFLHVPRTAGKTYATCFLRAALPASQRCSPSYDLLRLNVSQEGCRYLVSHDDYSVTSVS